MHVQVQTHPLGSLQTESKVIDWKDSSDRKWLMNHLHHCMNNQKGVNLAPLSDHRSN